MDNSNQNIFYVYEWVRLDTNEPFYVGKGKGNRAYAFNKNERNKHFLNICSKYEVAVNIMHNNLTEQEAFQYESWYINEYKYIMGYELTNLTDGGEGISGFKKSEEDNKSNRMRINGFDIEDYKDEIIDMYVNQKMSVNEIGLRFNVSKTPVMSCLKRNGIQLRSPGETMHYNKTGDKRYNSKYIIVKNLNEEIVGIFGSLSECGQWLVELKLVNKIGGGTKAIETYKNTNISYKSLLFYSYTKEEYNKLNIDKNNIQFKNVIIPDFNLEKCNNSIIVEVYDTNNTLLQIFNSNYDCIKWLCATELVNNINSAKNAIDRCEKSGKPYKNTYIFKKYNKDEYNKKYIKLN